VLSDYQRYEEFRLDFNLLNNFESTKRATHTLKMSGIELFCDYYFMNLNIFEIRLKIEFRKLFER